MAGEADRASYWTKLSDGRIWIARCSSASFTIRTSWRPTHASVGPGLEELLSTRYALEYRGRCWFEVALAYKTPGMVPPGLYELPLERKLKSLSRGMRVKAALASSLTYRPRLVVLDEPFSGLDALVRDQLIESILERASEATVFLASHDLAEIESFASHIAYLDEGQLRFVEETVRGRACATLYGRKDAVRIPVSVTRVAAPGVGRCYSRLMGGSPSILKLACESVAGLPTSTEARLVRKATGDIWSQSFTGSSRSNSVLNPSWLSPFDRAEAVFYGSDWLISRGLLPQASLELLASDVVACSVFEYELRNVKLDEFIVESDLRLPTSTR